MMKRFYLLLWVFIPISNSYANFITNTHFDGANYFIDSEVPEAAVISATIKGGEGDVFHLFSHGRPGELLIEGQWLDVDATISWIRHLNLSSSIKHISIYGCNYAKGTKGQEAFSRLSTALSMTISASDDVTGVTGDWELEVGHGPSIELISYNHDLQCLDMGLSNDCDLDGVPNHIDLDDDNDGILDSEENNCPISNFSTVRRWFVDIVQDTAYGTIVNPLTGNTIGVHVSLGTMRGRTTFFENIFGQPQSVLNPPTQRIIPSGNSTTLNNGTLYQPPIGTGTTGDYEMIIHNNERGYPSSITFDEPVGDLYLYFLTVSRPGQWVSYTFSAGGLGLQAIRTAGNPNLTVTNTATGSTVRGVEGFGSIYIKSGGRRFTRLDIAVDGSNPSESYSAMTLAMASPCDTDGDGFANCADLDSDGDRCPDVTESGGVDNDNNNMIDGVVDSLGRPLSLNNGGYNGTNGTEINPVMIVLNSSSLITTNSNSMASLVVDASAISTDTFTNGSPNYSAMSTDVSDSLRYQWYLGDPNAGGMPLSNGGVYSGTTSDSLLISNTAGLENNNYYVIVTHAQNVCEEFLLFGRFRSDDLDIPTLGEWGVLVLIIILLIVGIVAVRQFQLS